MRRRLLPPARYAALLTFFLIPGYGSLTTYLDPDQFNRAAPGLPTQTFTSALVGSGGVITCAGPITSNTANNCFPPGSLLPGVEYSATSGVLAAYGASYNNRTNSRSIFGVNDLNADLELTFESPVTAIAFTLSGGLRPTGPMVSVFSTTGTILGNYNPFLVGFFGIVSDADRIGTISITSQGPFPAAIGSLSFGAPTAAVPEPGTWALLAIALCGASLWRRHGARP